ncbi:hypothetical protein BDN70DRAFT_326247 [Pholiota conissans]|uniref:F-box domain-containing protein n=1 Tax=Pholiota conissans TaxID=109636 RepID=A0A9P5Z9F3_9AGAR|nr:hypothetical protein BDN70DRAFT_326247 [Pholiota conissans]
MPQSSPTPVDAPNDAIILTSIPPELLGEIFTYSTLHNPDAPLVLSAVCSTFHYIVHTTPSVWTRLYLEVSRPDATGNAFTEHPDARWARKAEMWFSMAGVCPVYLHVQMDVYAHSPRAQSMGEVSALQGNGDYRDELGQWHIQLLPCVLYQYRHKIHGLALHSTTVDEAQSFFTALYPPEIAGQNPEDSRIPLKNLTFHASSDGSHRASSLNLAHLRHKHKPATCISLSHCHFPQLAHLKFVNHPLPSIINESDILPWGPINNARSLRSLSITYPIRFTPISVYTLLQVLRSSPLLEKLEIEARVADAPPPTSLMPTSPTWPSTPISASTAPITPNTPFSAHQHHPDLITLPYLTFLSLRINNLPALLSHLLLPSLHTLRLDDLDGKRVGAAAQTGVVLRQLLVRMELPCEGVQRGSGLQVLDMCSIALAAPQYIHGHDEREVALNDAGSVWEWCFRRMRTLREVRAAKMDTEALWALITAAGDVSFGVTLANLAPSEPSSSLVVVVLALAVAIIFLSYFSCLVVVYAFDERLVTEVPAPEA